MIKNKNMSRIILSLIVIGFLGSCSGSKGKSDSQSTKPLMVFAGASLTNALAEIADSFEVAHHIHVKTNMASSGTLARQIEQGITPDVYISASKKWADYVDSLGYIKKGYKSQVAQNGLLLIAPSNSPLESVLIDSLLDIKTLLGDDRLSMGDPSHVPAGKYAQQALQYYGWDKVLKGKILPAKDVRSALMVVEMEEAPLGIVYRSDVLKSKKVKVVGTFPEQSHKPIVFVAGVCTESESAKLFYAYLSSDTVKGVLEKHGFKK